MNRKDTVFNEDFGLANGEAPSNLESFKPVLFSFLPLL